MILKDIKKSIQRLRCKLSRPKLPSLLGKGWGWGFFFLLALTSHAQQRVELKDWKFQTGDNTGWGGPGFDDSAWAAIQTGNAWEPQGYKDYDGYAWYRVRFTLPSNLKSSGAFNDSLQVMLGKIDDCDQTFLNGKLLGQNGEVMPADFLGELPDMSKIGSRYSVDRNYLLGVNDPRLLWGKENMIAVRVFDNGGGGGMTSEDIELRMKDLQDYISFDVDSKKPERKDCGLLNKTIVMQNHSPLAEIEGTLGMKATSPDGGKTYTSQSCPIRLDRNEAAFSFDFEGDLLDPMKFVYTFTEKKSGSQIIVVRDPDCNAGWVKYENNPILGGHLGTIFDVQVYKKEEGGFQMNCSWRTERSIAVSHSDDGLHWSKPEIILTYDQNSNWEQDISRPFIMEKDGMYHMWYTGQVWWRWDKGNSYIGYASSKDGKHWTKYAGNPILKPEQPWEDDGVIVPHVIWDEQENIYKMWYCAGDQFEPDAIGYATSKDGIRWDKYPGNPIFVGDKTKPWEQDKTTACYILKRENDYLMFYIGFMNAHHAQIGMARSKDGITNWERYPGNPIIKLGTDWDCESVYKPSVVADPENNRWLLYYNGRRASHEQMGVAIHKGMDLGF